MTFLLALLTALGGARPTSAPAPTSQLDRSSDAAWARRLADSARAGREDMLTWSNPDDGRGKARQRRERMSRELTTLLGAPTVNGGDTLVWRAKRTLTMSIQPMRWGEIVELQVE
jgi:hypothetical protein